jgi:hypothetical protein
MPLENAVGGHVKLMPPAEIWYVYGVAPSAVDLRNVPAGLDDTTVESCPAGDFAALVSRLDGARYDAQVLERATEDVEWLAPRAVAHDRVLTWASDHGPIVPLPIFSLFSSDDAVRRMLLERGAELADALHRASAGREYTLRVYRNDAELLQIASELSPRLAQLQQTASAASPGQRYLLERKLDAERRNELDSIGVRIAQEVVTALRPFALEFAESRIAPSGGRATADAPLILDAAFLVAAPRLESFRRELTEIVTRYGSRGFRFDFTGPWPPYHFVQRTAGGTRDG